VVRIAVTPEDIGLVGCCQVVGVRREVIPMGKGESAKTDELGLYVSSCALEQHTDEEMMEIIRGHWSAIENGTHYRRDVSLGEDACRVRDRGAASVLASLRNLAIGVYELEKHQERTKADSLPSWRRAQNFTTAREALRR
jgi:predicted transposase YbfD/YdcC